MGLFQVGWPAALYGVAFAILGADVQHQPGVLSAFGRTGGGPAEAGRHVSMQASRLDVIKSRGELGCGIEGAFPGFAEQDPQGRYHGLDIDICRAVAAAIFGNPDKVTFHAALAIDEFRRDDTIDLVSRRLTWELRREAALGLLFGPVTFYDGQGFLVPARLGVSTPGELAERRVCVAGGTVFEINLNEYAARRSLTIGKIIVESHHDHGDIAARLADGRCPAYTGDVSDLGAIRARLPRPAEFAILDYRISDEPLAPIVREHDLDLFAVVRWTIFALIAAEEMGITSANVDEMLQSPELAVRRFLGVVPGNGQALQLDERWAYHVIKSVGNYAEVFDRNLGQGSRIKLDRGRDRLFRDGGLMWAPPLR